MRHFFLIFGALAVLAVPVVVLAGGGESGFEGVVQSLESRYHAKAARIPFPGLVRLIAKKASHDGVSELNVAEFEHVSGPVDGDELKRMVEEKLGPGWERTIRETSRHGRDQTLIYMRPEGAKMGMFVVDLDGQELDVVQVAVDPERVDDSVSRYEHREQQARGSSESD